MKFLIFFLRTKAKLKPVGLVKSCIGEVGQELNRYSQFTIMLETFTGVSLLVMAFWGLL
jgi:hypothetical protein